MRNCSWKAHTEALGGPRAFHLIILHVSHKPSKPRAAVENGMRRTSQAFLNVSKSTNSRDTVSSLRMFLYCFNSRLHISVYSDSVTESLMYAFSRPSRVMMIP